MDDGRPDSDSNIETVTENMSDSTDDPMTGHNSRWEAVIDDMSATATEYRDAGWEALELHPGDIFPIPPVDGADQTGLSSSDGVNNTSTKGSIAQDSSKSHSRVGLDVIIPDNEFTQLIEIASARTFDECEAFRAEVGSILFVIAGIKASTTDVVVFVPLYYRANDAQRMAQRAVARGEIKLFVRPLSDDRQVVFSQSTPELLLPSEFAR